MDWHVEQIFTRHVAVFIFCCCVHHLYVTFTILVHDIMHQHHVVPPGVLIPLQVCHIDGSTAAVVSQPSTEYPFLQRILIFFALHS